MSGYNLWSCAPTSSAAADWRSSSLRRGPPKGHVARFVPRPFRRHHPVRLSQRSARTTATIWLLPIPFNSTTSRPLGGITAVLSVTNHASQKLATCGRAGSHVGITAYRGWRRSAVDRPRAKMSGSRSPAHAVGPESAFEELSWPGTSCAFISEMTTDSPARIVVGIGRIRTARKPSAPWRNTLGLRIQTGFPGDMRESRRRSSCPRRYLKATVAETFAIYLRSTASRFSHGLFDNRTSDFYESPAC